MNDDDVELPGADAEPLDAVEQARWNAVSAHTQDLAEAVVAEDSEGFAAAVEALGQARVDFTRVLNALHVPADAAVWAPALERILRRIPDQWGRWISCGPGWYPLLARLDERLAGIDPGYVLFQVKEKFGGLRYYVEPSPPRCCNTWDLPQPQAPGRSPASAEQEKAMAAHRKSAEHADGAADLARRRAAMDAEIARAEAEAAMTCELTGAPGRLMVTAGGWYRTLAPAVGAARGYQVVKR